METNFWSQEIRWRENSSKLPQQPMDEKRTPITHYSTVHKGTWKILPHLKNPGIITTSLPSKAHSIAPFFFPTDLTKLLKEKEDTKGTTMVHGYTWEPSSHSVPADEIYLERSRDKAPTRHLPQVQASAASGAYRYFTTLFEGGRRQISIQGRTCPASACSFPTASLGEMQITTALPDTLCESNPFLLPQMPARCNLCRRSGEGGEEKKVPSLNWKPLSPSRDTFVHVQKSVPKATCH